MDVTILAALIAAVVSTITTVAINLWLVKSSKKTGLNSQLDSILKIAIQYPYLESASFTDSWKSDFNQNDEKYLRYDIYCILLFNYLSRVSSFYKYNKKKIEKYIAIKDWIRLHSKYWNDPTSKYENVDSYDKDFIQLIKNYLQ